MQFLSVLLCLSENNAEDTPHAGSLVRRLRLPGPSRRQTHRTSSITQRRGGKYKGHCGVQVCAPGNVSVENRG